MDHDIGYATLDMRLTDGVRRHGADLGEITAGNIIQTVGVILRTGNGIGKPGPVKADDGLHQEALTLLDVLTHGMEVSRELHGGREDPLQILALTLAVELLPPLSHKAEAGFVAAEDLNAVALVVQILPGGSILPGGVCVAALVQGGKFADGGIDDLADVYPGDSHGKQTDSG